jgi:2-polyprenyl-3-methyl-5-hydroxy-6-metoxy-1,4-benzoquinol methylase
MTHSLPRTAAADEYDHQYRTWLEQHGPRALDLDWRLTHLEWRQRVLLRRYPPEGKRVLDFGCMDGVFTLRLQQMGAEAVGYDISPAAIAQAKQFRGTAARPVFTTVPPGPGQFDLIYCSEALENVGDDSGLVGELVGYLTAGGSVVGTTPIGDEHGGDPADRGIYDQAQLKRALSPYGRVHVFRYARRPVRDRLPFRKAKGGRLFLFQVTPPNAPGAR